MSTHLDMLFHEPQEYRVSDTQVPLDECLMDRGYVLRSPVECTFLDFETNAAPVSADVVGGAGDVQLEVA